MWMSPDLPGPSSSSTAPVPKPSKKRKLDSGDDQDTTKRLKLANKSNPNTPATGAKSGVKSTHVTFSSPMDTPSETPKGKEKARQEEVLQPATKASDDTSRPKSRRRKLVPPRPFPIVPPSVSATGPRSAHTEGKNIICITRKTKLGAYMRRCKDVVLKDGYKTLILTAMGAAIPHLMQLAAALPPILPWSPDEIHTEVTTGTVEVQDEIIPEDEEEDITYETRGKSTLRIVIKIGDGKQELSGRRNGRKGRDGKQQQRQGGNAPKAKAAAVVEPDVDVVLEEPEQMMDMI